MSDRPESDAPWTRFLLGRSTEDERVRIERQCLDRSEPVFAELLAHEDELRFDYLEGRLSPADCVRFEERYLDSEADRSRLTLARALLERGARAIARSVGMLLVALAIVASGAVRPLQAQADAPLTLDAAVAEALQRSPQLQPRHDAILLAAIRQRLAASQFSLKFTPSLSAASDPALGATRMAGLLVSKQLATGGQVFFNVSSYALGGANANMHDAGYTIGVTQPLFRGFSRTATADLTTAERAGTAAGRALSAARAELVVRVTQQYFAVVKQQRLAAAARDAVDRAVKLKTASRARTRVGLATELDVLRAEIQESQMVAALASADGVLMSARDQLAMLLGRRLGAPLDVDSNPDVSALAEPSVPAGSIDDLVRMALASRVEAVEARDRVDDARRTSEIAGWNTLPPVSLDVSYTQRGLGQSSGGALNALLGGWRVGLSTTYAVDRAAQSAALGIAQVNVAASQRAVAEAEQEIVADVRQVYRAWHAADATIAIQTQAVKLAQREMELAELRSERGLGDTLDVVGAQNSLLQAQNALIAAELDRVVLGLDLRRAVGALDTGRLVR